MNLLFTMFLIAIAAACTMVHVMSSAQYSLKVAAVASTKGNELQSWRRCFFQVLSDPAFFIHAVYRFVTGDSALAIYVVAGIASIASVYSMYFYV